MNFNREKGEGELEEQKIISCIHTSDYFIK